MRRRQGWAGGGGVHIMRGRSLGRGGGDQTDESVCDLAFPPFFFVVGDAPLTPQDLDLYPHFWGQTYLELVLGSSRSSKAFNRHNSKLQKVKRSKGRRLTRSKGQNRTPYSYLKLVWDNSRRKQRQISKLNSSTAKQLKR